jgi:sugar-specific transcriptional regulator TrmB
MGEEPIKKILKDFGLTEKESEVYIFLSKHGVLKCGEIAKGMKRHKAQIYRILKILQSKGLIETTLETPTRFSPVPFEKVLDLSIKAKHDEAALMEKTRQEVVAIWKNIRQAGLESSLQKFFVLEGTQKIYSKFAQLLKNAQSEVSAIISFPDLMRADNFGILDNALLHPLRSKLQFRFLTEMSSQNIDAVKTLLKNTRKAGFNFKVRNPDLGLQLSPRMVIRDNDEMLFFITKKDQTVATPDETCLWTNCKELVHSFSSIFNDLWQKSTEIQLKISEFETGKPTPQTYAISDLENAKKKYDNILEEAKDEIVFITSAEGLISLSKRILLLKRWAQKGVFVRIMAPIVSENLNAAQHLSECCFVKHTPASYINTTQVDGKHLFQFKNQGLHEDNEAMLSDFKNGFYTSDPDYIVKTKNLINDIWKNASEISDAQIVSLDELLGPSMPSLPKGSEEYSKMMGWIDYPKKDVISEVEIINKFMAPERIPAKDPLKDIVRYYGSRGIGIVPRSETLNLPDMVIIAFHWNEYSSFGPENRLMIYLKIDNQKGGRFVPVATVGDNADAMLFLRGTQAGTASAKTQLVSKDELQVRLEGNTLFAGWTVPIELGAQGRSLPPGCVLIEAYGDTKTSLRKSISPSGRMQVSMFTVSEAALTFLGSESRYSGPGTDAFVHRYVVSTTYPPINTANSKDNVAGTK